MIGRIAILTALLWLGAAPAHARDSDDEVWIGRYIASGQAPGISRRDKSVRSVEFGELATMSGRRLRFILNDGRERRGIVAGVEGGQVKVRAQVGGGLFLYSLSRSDIRAIQAD
ncbi:MAG: hypothetical protein WCZ65_06775 [Lysobacteraceae bacterium]